MKEIVSIIIPLYNAEKFIRSTLLSCINQSYSNLEIIVVDDCSTDNSLEIAREVSRNKENVIIKRNNNNEGLIKTINHGYSISKGDYIIVLGNDDILAPNHVQIMHSIFSGEQYSFVYCSSKYINEDGEVFGKSNTINIKDNGFLFSKRNIVNSCGLMIRRDMLDAVGGYPDYLGFRHYGEWYLWILLHSRCTGFYTDSIQSNYRIHKANMTKSLYSKENLINTRDYNIKCMRLAYNILDHNLSEKIRLIIYRFIYALKIEFHIITKSRKA